MHFFIFGMVNDSTILEYNVVAMRGSVTICHHTRVRNRMDLFWKKKRIEKKLEKVQRVLKRAYTVSLTDVRLNYSTKMHIN